MKISELAKDLNITSKEVIKFLQDNGYDYKSSEEPCRGWTDIWQKEQMHAETAQAIAIHAEQAILQ